MDNQNIQCPKCHGEMIQGFLPDQTPMILVAAWHPGHPKKSFWTGTKAPLAEGIPIGAFRCEKCGFLEFYADPVFAAK